MSLFRIILFLLSVSLFSSCGKSNQVHEEGSFEKIKALIQTMESQGSLMAVSLDSIAHTYQRMVENREVILQNPGPFKYKFEGPFSTNLPGQDSTLSSIIILNTTPNRKKAEEEVLLTNGLDSLFRDFFRANPMAVQIYSNSAMQVSRVYPAYDVKNIVDPDIDVTSFNFYYEADSAHNPPKGLVWIPDAYVDPAGKGWILSLIHPVYAKNELFAVLGVDFTVTDLIQNYMESIEGNFLLVNGKGDIVAAKGEAIEYLGMPPLKNFVYREAILSDSFRMSDFNLFHSKSEEVRNMAQTFLLNKENRFDFQEEPNLDFALSLPFHKINWHLIELFPKP